MVFNFLPIDIELLIFSKYFTSYVLPELKNKIKKKYFKENVLIEIVDIAIKDKAARLINDVLNLNDSILECQLSILKIDQLFYQIIDSHYLGIIDIFT